MKKTKTGKNKNVVIKGKNLEVIKSTIKMVVYSKDSIDVKEKDDSKLTKEEKEKLKPVKEEKKDKKQKS